MNRARHVMIHAQTNEVVVNEGEPFHLPFRRMAGFKALHFVN